MAVDDDVVHPISASEIDLAKDLIAAVIDGDLRRFERLFEEAGAASDLPLQLDLTAIALFVGHFSYFKRRRRPWLKLPKPAERAQIVQQLAGGPFGDLLDRELLITWLDRFCAKVSAPAELMRRPRAAATAVVLCAYVMDTELKNWSRVFAILTRRLKRRGAGVSQSLHVEESPEEPGQ